MLNYTVLLHQNYIPEQIEEGHAVVQWGFILRLLFNPMTMYNYNIDFVVPTQVPINMFTITEFQLSKFQLPSSNNRIPMVRLYRRGVGSEIWGGVN